MEMMKGGGDEDKTNATTHNQSFSTTSTHSSTEQPLQGNTQNVGRMRDIEVGGDGGGGTSFESMMMREIEKRKMRDEFMTERIMVREIEKRKMRDEFITEGIMVREIEKNKIRDEMITERILRRRELEDEVSRELVMEREGFSLPFSSMQSDFRSSFFNGRHLSRLKQRSVFCPEGVTDDGRLSLVPKFDGGNEGKLSAMNRLDCEIDGRLSLVKCPESGVIGGFPFQHEPRVTNGVAVKPVIDLRKGKSISLVKPVKQSLAGVKCKFETPIAEGGDKVAALVTRSKKSQKEWSCDLCQVSATSQQGLEDHLKGRKHKAKENASLTTRKTLIDNPGQDTSPEETDKSAEFSVPTDNTSPKLNNILDGNQETNLKLKLTKDLDMMNGGLPVMENRKKFDSDNSNFKFWCSMCEFGTTNEESMTDHRMGEKHTTLLKQRRGCVIVINTLPQDHM